MIGLVLAAAVAAPHTYDDVKAAIAAQLEVQQLASVDDRLHAGGYVWNPQEFFCDREKGEIAVAGAMRAALAKGYLWVSSNGGYSYDLSPDDRQTVEAQAVQYETDAQEDRIRCGS